MRHRDVLSGCTVLLAWAGAASVLAFVYSCAELWRAFGSLAGFFLGLIRDVGTYLR